MDSNNGVVDYTQNITGQSGNQDWITAPFNGLVFLWGKDSYKEEYTVYVSPDGGTTRYPVGYRFDDYNGNTQGTAFSFPIKIGWSFNTPAENGSTYWIYKYA